MIERILSKFKIGQPVFARKTLGVSDDIDNIEYGHVLGFATSPSGSILIRVQFAAPYVLGQHLASFNVKDYHPSNLTLM